MTSNIKIMNQENKAINVLSESGYVINKGYLPELNTYQVKPLFQNELNTKIDVSLFKINRIVFNNKQSVIESLTAAYAALGAAGFTVFFYINSDGNQTSLYIGTRGKPKKVQGSSAGRLLEETFKGHFSGSDLEKLNGNEVEELLNRVQSTSASESITAVSGVPSLAIENQENFMQGLERFIDAADGRQYQGIILAEPIERSILDTARVGYENIATQLSPFLKQTISYGENQSVAISDALSKNFSESVGESISLTEALGSTHTIGTSETTGTTESFTSSTSSSSTKNGIISSIPVLGPLAAAMTGRKSSTSVSSSESSTYGTNQSQTLSNSTAESITNTKGYTDSITKTHGRAITTTDTETVGSNKTMTLESINKSVENLLRQIDSNLERIEEANRYGGWNTAAYFIGENFASSESLASIFLGLMRGENSHTENFALTTWDSSNDNFKQILKWLRNLSHPRLRSDSLSTIVLSNLTPATLVSGREMAVQLSLPRKSTSGTVVIEAQAFGRKVQYLNDQSNVKQKAIELGNIRHLWCDKDQQVTLALDQLSSHMFVTGSTGSGKSNTLYEIISQLDKFEIPFLVIEPAKGEYKHVFGHKHNVAVFGTNPQTNDLLKINPFYFSNSIHIYEHIDRLVEIFNVCWPMYAAMPAILKEAILDSYVDCGWSLSESKNLYGEEIYPSFTDVLYSLEKVVTQSDFSEEVKSNYIGSLVTRVKSLTNGLNGQIFSGNEIPLNQLFNHNCIIDLSRVGSTETKSLIMGIILLKLNEHRMDEGGMNLPLKHVTILEEAHNILKATTASSSEGGESLEAKSVEMITNSIAEMRTYGEGFIIVDQSPNAVDIAAIRNTNTKIVMRLPEEVDRRTAGKAMGLKDEQLAEISKLPTGIALVNQNNWIEPVLCHVSMFEGNITPWSYSRKNESLGIDTIKTKQAFLYWILKKRIPQSDFILTESELVQLQNNLGLSSRQKLIMMGLIKEFLEYGQMLIQNDEQFLLLSEVVVDLLNLTPYLKQLKSLHNMNEVVNCLNIMTLNEIGRVPDALSLAFQQCIMKVVSQKFGNGLQIYSAWVNHYKEQQ